MAYESKVVASKVSKMIAWFPFDFAIASDIDDSSFPNPKNAHAIMVTPHME
jgi:hypothetical protein